MTGKGPASALVAYVAYTFPVLTQTFTVREVAALRRCGVDVQVYAYRRDGAAALDPVAAEEGRRAEYLASPLSIEALCAFAWFAVRRPVRLIATLLSCLGGRYRESGASLRVRALLHATVGVVLARRLVRRPATVRVHAQFVDAGSTVAYVAARLTGCAFSFMNHTAYNPFLLPLKLRHADAALSISEFDRQRVLDECGVEYADRVHVQRVGIDTEAWADVVRREVPGRALIVGALRQKKGHVVLLRAARLLKDEGTHVEVCVAGDGAEREHLERLADDLDLDVEFLGAVGPEVVRSELTRASVFVLPCVVADNGDLDGVPVAIMEAMAAAVPTISSRLSGIPELIEHGTSGLLAEPGDAGDLATQLGRVLGDRALAERLGRAGRERVRSLHDLSVTSRALAERLVGASA